MSTARPLWPAATLTAIVVLAWGSCAAAGEAPSVAQMDQHFPKGSITTPADANRALVEAAAGQKGLDERYVTERARCAHVFLATQCLDNARREHAKGSTVARRIEVEAHDLQRQQAASERQAHREVEQARQDEDDAERGGAARRTAETPKKSASHAAESNVQAQRHPAQEAVSREQYERRNAEHDRDQAKQVEVQIRNRADNARRFEDKQAQAKAYAVGRAHERAENEKSRAEHERERKKKFEESGAVPVAPPAVN